jgi:maltose O-acetyltransferase
MANTHPELSPTEPKTIALDNIPGYRWARRLPKPIKRPILACFWVLKALLEDLQDYTAEVVGYIPSHAIRMFWLMSFCRIKVGNHSSIHRRCRLYHPHKITIGHGTIINYGVLLDGRGGLVIGDNVSVSEGSVILSQSHDIDSPNFELRSSTVLIEDYAFIGSYARILPGVTIGEGAVVAVGAVVTRDVEPYSVVGGVPARFIRERPRGLTYSLSHRKRFG